MSDNDSKIDDELENGSTFMQENDDSSFEVKQSFFEKIRERLTRPRLSSGNNVRTTNMSFNSWNIRATFRRAFESISNSVSNIMKKNEPEVRNGFSTTIIGKDDNSKSTEINQEKSSDQTITKVIPPIRTQYNVQAKSIINNTNTTKDISQEQDFSGEELKLEEIQIDDLEKNSKDPKDTQTKYDKTTSIQTHGIEIGNINISKQKQERDSSERE